MFDRAGPGPDPWMMNVLALRFDSRSVTEVCEIDSSCSQLQQKHSASAVHSVTLSPVVPLIVICLSS